MTFNIAHNKRNQLSAQFFVWNSVKGTGNNTLIHYWTDIAPNIEQTHFEITLVANKKQYLKPTTQKGSCFWPHHPSLASNMTVFFLRYVVHFSSYSYRFPTALLQTRLILENWSLLWTIAYWRQESLVFHVRLTQTSTQLQTVWQNGAKVGMIRISHDDDVLHRLGNNWALKRCRN